MVNEDDPGAAAIADLSPGRRYGFSTTAEVRRGRVRQRQGGRPPRHGRRPDVPAARRPSTGPALQALLAAAAAALAAGALPEEAPAARGPAVPRDARRPASGRLELIDDGMAATPAKTASTLDERPDGSVVLVAGGELESAGLPVHASPEEERLLEQACAEAQPRRPSRRPLRPGRRPARAVLRPGADDPRREPRRGDPARVRPRRRREDARRLADVPAAARRSRADRARARGARRQRLAHRVRGPVRLCETRGVRVTMLLADFAQVSDGKLTVVGGGWSLTGPEAVPFGIAILIRVPVGPGEPAPRDAPRAARRRRRARRARHGRRLAARRLLRRRPVRGRPPGRVSSRERRSTSRSPSTPARCCSLPASTSGG